MMEVTVCLLLFPIWAHALTPRYLSNQVNEAPLGTPLTPLHPKYQEDQSFVMISNPSLLSPH